MRCKRISKVTIKINIKNFLYLYYGFLGGYLSHDEINNKLFSLLCVLCEFLVYFVVDIKALPTPLF